MNDHHHSEYATHVEVNGFGQRVDGLKERTAVQESKTMRNEKDIQDIFTLVGNNAKAAEDFRTATATKFGELETAMVDSVGAIDKKVSNLKWWLLGGLGAAGTILKYLL